MAEKVLKKIPLTATILSNGTITISKPIRELLGLNVGDRIKLEIPVEQKSTTAHFRVRKLAHI